MKTSSARQPSSDYSPTGPAQENGSAGLSSEALARLERNEPDYGMLKVPDFSAHGQAFAATSRLAGRINAAAVSDSEEQALLAERQLLLDKQFDGSISKKETNRLEYVRWSLDRIEDARYGHGLDLLESSVAAYEQFLGDVQDLHEQLIQRTTVRRK